MPLLFPVGVYPVEKMDISKEQNRTTVSREEFLRNPKHYASLANEAHRVFINGSEGCIIMVLGGTLNLDAVEENS